MELVIGLAAVVALGFIMHFVYRWSGNALLVGLFAPVNESAWEHMKLVYLPMIILSVIVMTRWENELPPATAGMLAGTFVGTWMIPVLFYTYRGIVGFGVPWADMATFFVAVVGLGLVVLHIVKRCEDDRLRCMSIIFGVLVVAQGVAFLWFTYHPAGIGLFASP